MSQGTGIQALSRAYSLTGATKYRDAAAAAIGAFQTAPPAGVAVPASGGTHYLMYSYAPQLLCRRKGTPVYCEKEARFTQYLAQPPG